MPEYRVTFREEPGERIFALSFDCHADNTNHAKEQTIDHFPLAVIVSVRLKNMICSLCRNTYEGYGNNAEPLHRDRCCDDCNITKVIPARLNIITRQRT